MFMAGSGSWPRKPSSDGMFMGASFYGPRKPSTDGMFELDPISAIGY
jgi:hypothetical protein